MASNLSVEDYNAACLQHTDRLHELENRFEELRKEVNNEIAVEAVKREMDKELMAFKDLVYSWLNVIGGNSDEQENEAAATIRLLELNGFEGKCNHDYFAFKQSCLRPKRTASAPPPTNHPSLATSVKSTESEKKRGALALRDVRQERLLVNPSTVLPIPATPDPTVKRHIEEPPRSLAPPPLLPPALSSSPSAFVSRGIHHVAPPFVQPVEDYPQQEFSYPDKPFPSTYQHHQQHPSNNVAPCYYQSHHPTIANSPQPRTMQQQYPEPIDTARYDVNALIHAMREGFTLPKMELKTFDGNPLDYFAFMKMFDMNIHMHNHAAEIKLAHLIQLCRGIAYESIRDMVLVEPAEAGYQQARDTLRARFGNRNIVIRATIKQLLDGPQLLDGDFDGLRRLAASMKNCEVVLRSWDSNAMDGYENLAKIFLRLPRKLQETYADREDNVDHPSFTHMVRFVEKKAFQTTTLYGRLLCEASKSRRTNNNPSNQIRFSRSSNHATVSSTYSSEISSPTRTKTAIKCAYCEHRHELHACGQFRSLDIHGRTEFVKSKNLCFNCLRQGHFSSTCSSQGFCKVSECGKRHHSLIHPDNTHLKPRSPKARPDTRPKTQSGNGAGNSNLVSSIIESLPVRLKVLPVYVLGSDSTPVLVHCFIDSGSNRSLCSLALARKLGIEGTPQACVLDTANGPKLHKGIRVSLQIRGLDMRETLEMPDVLAINKLPDVGSSILTPETLHQHPHLRELPLPLVGKGPIDLLLGSDVLHKVPVLETRMGDGSVPTAEKTMLGWVVYGPDSTMIDGSSSVNFLAETSYPSPLGPLCKSCKVDFADLCCDPFVTEPSRDDKRAIQMLVKSTSKVNGRYEVGLPWKSEGQQFENNYQLAHTRLMSQKTKFKRDPELFSNYCEKIRELIDNGYAEFVPVEELEFTNRTNFIPHHSTGGKFRVVFDCSAKFKGSSLNQRLLSGPDLTNNLMGVLMRFRQEPVAFCADIRSMFLRVRLSPADRDAMRFLWFRDSDLDKEPIQLRMCSHLFGATSSPCVASYALRRVADDNLSQADGAALATIRRNFYVDDLLKSVASCEEAIAMISSTRSLLATGGFHLAKFRSNFNEILSCVPEDDCVKGAKTIKRESQEPSNTLGLKWNTTNDMFEIALNIDPKPLTRRGMLSMIAQCFDSLGFIQPFLLPARKMLQELSKSDLSWDAPVPVDTKRKFDRWRTGLDCLSKLRILRCYHTGFQRKVTRTQLHCFCDASTVAYGAVAYLRFVYEGGEINCSFVKGLSRVTPLHHVTIPRLELTAAVSAANLVASIRRELDLGIDDAFLWTDSLSTLYLINNMSSRFKTFVANRLTQIHSVTLPSQWRYVDTKTNPADIASRGIGPNASPTLTQIWLNGPEFLRKNESNWPAFPQKEEFVVQPTVRREFKINYHHDQVITASPPVVITRLFSRYSCWERLKRSVAWLKRFVMFIRSKSKGHPSPATGYLKVAELDSAELTILRTAQRESLPLEISYFRHKEGLGPSGLNKRSVGSRNFKTLLRLNAFYRDGLLLVGGRLRYASMSSDAKTPIILPSRHHITDLIVRHYHVTSGHSGVLHVLSNIRSRFWIIRGQSVVRAIIRKCITCRVRNAKPAEQWMGNLPVSRLQSGHKPFHNTMLDFIGPIKVKMSRKCFKRYACVFTCMSSRAVHIEVAESLETSAFLEAFFRFCDRRSNPKNIYSDNGTNFVGANRILAEGWRNLNQDNVARSLSQRHIQWHFQPPLASHQSGAIERLNREVRKIFDGLLNNREPTDFSLLSILTGVERILNERPLTPLSDDPRDLEALSPSTLLTGTITPEPPPDRFIKTDEFRQSWRFVQLTLERFWKRWTSEYLPRLQIRQKWVRPKRNFRPGDLVLMLEGTNPRGAWPKARVQEVLPDRDGLVRRVLLYNGESSLWRDVRKVCLLEGVESDE